MVRDDLLKPWVP